MKAKESSTHILSSARVAYESALLVRLEFLCYIISFSLLLFGFNSIEFIQKFDPSITLFDNVWPRFLFNTVPYFLIGQYIRRASHQPATKIRVFIWFYSFLFSVAAMVHVWPLALQGHGEIFLYVNGANVAYLCGILSLAAISKDYRFQLITSNIIFIVLPILTVAYLSGDSGIMNAVVSDTALAMGLANIVGAYGSKVLWELEVLRAKQEKETEVYLGETLKQAIYNNRMDLIAEKECSAYVFLMDIRDSTRLTKKYGSAWSEFNKEWLESALRILRSYGGTFVKSTGDGMLGAFGLFDEENIVQDVPNLEDQNMEADEVRWTGLTVDTYGCLEQMMLRFEVLATKYFPDEVVRIACGLDRGKVYRGVRGTDQRKEFDIWGDKVNMAAKLEAFSKTIAPKVDPEASLLVVSPYAADFLDQLSGFQRVEADKSVVQGLHGIKWVLVRTYRNQADSKSPSGSRQAS